MTGSTVLSLLELTALGLGSAIAEETPARPVYAHRPSQHLSPTVGFQEGKETCLPLLANNK
jgi:hypothetical protein